MAEEKEIDMNTDREKIIAESANHNLAELIEQGPGLRYSTRTWVLAKDSKRKRVLLGGLGCMGCGQMWFDDKDKYKEDPTYKDAPEQEES